MQSSHKFCGQSTRKEEQEPGAAEGAEEELSELCPMHYILLGSSLWLKSCLGFVMFLVQNIYRIL